MGLKLSKNSKDENDTLSVEVTINDLKEEAKDSNDESGVEDDADLMLSLKNFSAFKISASSNRHKT